MSLCQCLDLGALLKHLSLQFRKVADYFLVDFELLPYQFFK